jgi:hypothetical protein
MVLCRYDAKGAGAVYREGDRAYWFASLDSRDRWIKALPLPEKFYSFPLRGPRAQHSHLKRFKKDGFVGVMYDPRAPGEDMIPIDDLIAAIGLKKGTEDVDPETEY